MSLHAGWSSEANLITPYSEHIMRYRPSIAICATAVTLLVSSFAHAQTTPSAGDDAASSAMAPASKKQMRADNHALSKAVRRALAKTKGLETSGITVLSRGGAVTLDGTVPDNNQIPLAGTAASSTHGVTSVDNRLTMREEGH
jgi:hyperosmotically inducible periplasmic protein